MNTTTALTIPPQTSVAVQPKPTKAEVIDALTEIKIQQLEAEAKAASAKREKLKGLLTKQLRSLAHKAGTKNAEVDIGWSNGDSFRRQEVTINVCDILTPEIKANIKEYEALRGCTCTPERRVIRASIARQCANLAPREERIDTLITDKKSRAALEAMLKLIEGKK